MVNLDSHWSTLRITETIQLVAVTEEAVIELEKRFWSLVGNSPSGR